MHLGRPLLCNELICSAEQVALAMPDQVLGPGTGLVWTVIPMAGEPWVQAVSLRLSCLSGLEHHFDFPALLTPLVKRW